MDALGLTFKCLNIHIEYFEPTDGKGIPRRLSDKERLREGITLKS